MIVGNSRKYGLTILCCLILAVACAPNSEHAVVSAWDTPLNVRSDLELRDAIADLSGSVSAQQLELLKDAIGVLFLTDLEHLSKSAFISEVIDGRTPQELMELAEPQRERYRF